MLLAFRHCDIRRKPRFSEVNLLYFCSAARTERRIGIVLRAAIRTEHRGPSRFGLAGYYGHGCAAADAERRVGVVLSAALGAFFAARRRVAFRGLLGIGHKLAVEFRICHETVRRDPIIQYSESKQREYIPTDKAEVQAEQSPLIPFHYLHRTLTRVVGFHFRIVAHNEIRHGIRILFDYARDKEKQRPQKREQRNEHVRQNRTAEVRFERIEQAVYLFGFAAVDIERHLRHRQLHRTADDEQANAHERACQSFERRFHKRRKSHRAPLSAHFVPSGASEFT